MPEEVKSAHKKDESIQNAAAAKRRIGSMSKEEIIQENLKELLEKQSREERKANGRLVAVIVAFLVIFLAIYHAWIRKTAILAGVLVPAVIMLSYGGWVVILAKRDKQKRAMFEKHLEDIALKNKAELEAKVRLKHFKKSTNLQPLGATTQLHYENEIPVKSTSGEHRKHRKHRHASRQSNDSSCSHTAPKFSPNIKGRRAKRPSIRQKLFRQHPTAAGGPPASRIMLQPKRHRLQRLNALSVPPLVRIGSAP